MMTNLFSIFDPSSMSMKMGWTMMLMTLITQIPSTYKNKKIFNMTLANLTTKIENEMSLLMGKSIKKMSSKLLIKIFLIIMMMNLLALFPFNFTPTAHMIITFSLSLTIWMSSLMLGWSKNSKNMMIHMTPMGTPTPLMNFMVIIEMTSNLIRPITLSVRLSANMVAGHLLISLLSSFSMMTTFNSSNSMIIMFLLEILEMMVAMIQAYVLITLATLYHNESMH